MTEHHDPAGGALKKRKTRRTERTKRRASERKSAAAGGATSRGSGPIQDLPAATACYVGRLTRNTDATMADDEPAGALRGPQEAAGGFARAVTDLTGAPLPAVAVGGETGTTATAAIRASAGPADAAAGAANDSGSETSDANSPLPKKLYRHQSLTVGDRLINTYVADRSPDSPQLTRQGFCVGFSGTYAEPRVRMLLDNGQQITVLMSSVQRVAEEDVVFEGDPADRELWMAEMEEDVRGDLKRVVAELHRRATQIRKRIKRQRKEQHMEQQQKQQQQQEKKRQKMDAGAVDTADTSADDNDAGEADSKPAAADAEAPSLAAAASTELTTEQKRERLALKRKRLELEVAQKKLAAAQAKATNAQKRSLLHKKKEQEQALTLAGRSRHPTPVPGEEVAVLKPPPRKKRKLTDLAALRRPGILIDNISSSGPRALVYIQPRKQCSSNNDGGAEAKTRLPTPQREEKKSELQKRQREVMERRAELLRKAEMLKQKQQEKRKSLDAEGDDADDNDGGGESEANDDGENGKAADNGLNDDAGIRSGAASEAENDGAESGEEIDQMEQLRLRRLELQSAISQQAQTQTELKNSIEVQNLRGMVRTQLGVLTKQGQNLSERTAQLKQCTTDIEAERKEVEDAEQRLEELLEKKRRWSPWRGRLPADCWRVAKRRQKY